MTLMSLNQFHAIKDWYAGHPRPMEQGAWDLVVCLWMMGWVGLPASLLLHLAWGVVACLAVMYLPSVYVTCRRRLHRSGRLRADWITALR